MEITGPVERKMVINALNANVKVFMADFETHWRRPGNKVIEGQINLRDAVNGTVSYTSPEGKAYPQSWIRQCYLPGARPAPAGKTRHLRWRRHPWRPVRLRSYFLHNQALLVRARAPTSTCPSCRAIWKDAGGAGFAWTEDRFGLPRGTIKTTVLIKKPRWRCSEMDELLYQMKDHASRPELRPLGLHLQLHQDVEETTLIASCRIARWSPWMALPVGLFTAADQDLPQARPGHMAAWPPSFRQRSGLVNAEVFAKVKADKEREASSSITTAPGRPPRPRRYLPWRCSTPPSRRAKNQIGVLREPMPHHCRRAAGLRGRTHRDGHAHQYPVALQYLEAWINGNGCVPIYGLMEDAATAGISRTSIWRWIRHGKSLSNGEQVVNRGAVPPDAGRGQEAVRRELGDARWQAGRFAEAKQALMEER